MPSRSRCAIAPRCSTRRPARSRAIRIGRRPHRGRSSRRSARDPGRLRVGFTLNTGNGAPLDPACRSALEQCARLCADLGHHVEEADPGIDGAATWATFRTLLTANILVVLGGHPTKKRMPRAGEVEHVTLNTARLGEAVSAADYVRATQAGHRLCRHMAQYHETYDVLLTPALAAPPVRLGWLDMMLEDVHEYWRRIESFTPFSVWFNITGQPAMMLPMGFDGGPAALGPAGRALRRRGDAVAARRAARGRRAVVRPAAAMD